MDRRKFITSSLAAGSTWFLSYPAIAGMSQSIFQNSTRLVTVHEPASLDKNMLVNSEKVLKMLDLGMTQLFKTESPAQAWQRIVKPGEVIGLKVNCLSGRGTTHPELVQAVTEKLQEAGIRARDIVIWDRFNTDLEECGFRINTDNNKIKCMGNEVLGFEDEFEIFGNAASLVCKTLTRVCDGIINLPVLKDHGIAGITMTMKNFFGAIHNPNKYHMDTGNPFIADVYGFKSIQKKVRLHICDALVAQYEGGPSWMPQWTWPLSRLILGTDAVAMDHYGWQIIEKERKLHGLKSLKEVGREPLYIATAANGSHRLGTNDPARIEYINI